ncbi:hypothetical protein B0H15DRAFT_1019629 [Mycena belliarum]|uniref:Uncharacterized protein n=1 Tax=Mycena belliarum TaxID=1033014 RepID=A0AAD6UGW8_9AGAR|nr:hypothetical protein B0H15DRAFT_1019629 [Mycena belliae]
MSDSDSESLSESTILPALGACVVFTIDAVASLDPETLEDPEAVKACMSLASKPYVGFVAKRMGIYQPWNPHNGCMIGFLLQGRPKSIPSKSLESSMSIPIAPMTIGDHPSSRSPLNPSNPLPWNDCYLSTFWSAKVLSPTLMTETPIACKLARDEMRQLSRFLMADVRRHDILSAESSSASRSADLGDAEKEPGAPNPASSAEYDTAQPPSSGLRATIPPLAEDRGMLFSSPIGKPAIDDETESVKELIDYIFSKPASEMPITVNFTNDLSTVKELNDPADYFNELKALVRIREESRLRLASARALAIKEAAELNAKYDEPTINMLLARPQRRGRLSRFASATKKRIAGPVRPLLRFLWLRK